MRRMALIDGDVVAHIACKNRWEWLQNKRGISKENPVYSYKPPEEGYEFTTEEKTKYIQECWKNFKSHISSMLAMLFLEDDDYLMAVKASSNFRDDIYSEYKAHRKTDNPNDTVDILRDLAVHHNMAIYAEGREADDYLRIWSIELKEQGISPIICSIDKDLLCIPAQHFDLKKNILIEVDEWQALLNYYEQLLKGDATDNVPGLPNIGPKRASLLLSNCETEEELQEAVCMAYQAAYGDEWKNYLLSNGKMIYIQKYENDFFSLETWKVPEFKQTEEEEIEEPIAIAKVKTSAKNIQVTL
jgi:5'-3' exonuclease